MIEQKEFNPNTYWEDRLNKIKGLEGVGFKKLGLSFNKWAYKIRKKIVFFQIDKLQINNFNQLKILDVGSGTGFYIQLWKELQVKNITGVDLTDVAILNLKNTFPQYQFFQSDIGEINFNINNKFEKYDIVSCLDVLFHIVDDNRFEQSIKNISSIINPNGYFIYSDLFMDGKTIRGDSHVCRTEKYLMPLFEQNGFELVSKIPFMYLTNKPVDKGHFLLKIYWFFLENGLYIFPFLGNIIGAILFPLELAILKIAKKSPSTELRFFKKVR